MTSDYTRILS